MRKYLQGSACKRWRLFAFFGSDSRSYTGFIIASTIWLVSTGITQAQTSAPSTQVSRPAAYVDQPVTSNGDSQDAIADRDAVTLSLGGSAWSGDFGSHSTTDISAGLLSAQYNRGDWHVAATLPYTRITTAGDVFLGIGATPLIVRPETTSVRRVNEGVGDLTLNASYLTPGLPALGLDIELLGGVKIPTASSASRVSTGKSDFSLGSELSRPIGRIVPFVSVIYRDFGSSSRLPLRDGIASSVGASYVVSDQIVVNASYDYARSASHFVSDAHEIVASASYRFPHYNIRLSSYASAGLSQGAPAISGGLSLEKMF